MKHTELKLCGLPAVQARWKKDPDSIQRLFFDKRTGQQVGKICSVLAATRRIYRCVETAELEKIAGSHHHGGIVAVVAQAAERLPSADELEQWAKTGEGLLILDHIGNPHNLGALARTAAFLGVKQIIIADAPEAARGNDAAYRVSEGGLEAVTLWSVADLPNFLLRLVKAGYSVVGAATRSGKLLRPGGGAPTNVKVHGGRGQARVVPQATPLALVLGNEEKGMSAAVAAQCTRLVTIAGGGEVESLNVSVAGAILLWELLGPRKAQS